MNNSLRSKTIRNIVISLIIFLAIYVSGMLCENQSLEVNFANKNLAPCLSHIFGCDKAGRDMLLRTLKGLFISVSISFVAVSISVLIALFISFLVSIGNKAVDKVVCWVIDTFLSIPQMIFLILICVALGRGITSVIVGIALTHWTRLARLLRSETKQIMVEPYIQVAQSFGKSKLSIYINHVLPHLIDQVGVSITVLFPHAILHEASISFLGFGLPLEIPAIGIILAESMGYIMQGYWWLAFFPGLMLVIVVIDLLVLGKNVKRILGLEEIGY